VPKATIEALIVTGSSDSTMTTGGATTAGAGAASAGRAAAAAGLSAPRITMERLSGVSSAGSVTKDEADAAALAESSRQRAAKMRSKADVLDAVTDRTGRPENGQAVYWRALP
jgi:hypothetical protein